MGPPKIDPKVTAPPGRRGASPPRGPWVARAAKIPGSCARHSSGRALAPHAEGDRRFPSGLRVAAAPKLGRRRGLDAKVAWNLSRRPCGTAVGGSRLAAGRRSCAGTASRWRSTSRNVAGSEPTPQRTAGTEDGFFHSSRSSKHTKRSRASAPTTPTGAARHLALSYRDGTAEITINVTGEHRLFLRRIRRRGAGRVAAEAGFHGTPGLLPAIELDNILNWKLDVQGLEPAVLAGASETLARVTLLETQVHLTDVYQRHWDFSRMGGPLRCSSGSDRSLSRPAPSR